ncbi:hypothetical protein EV363DRAFT_1420651 [Boletus edulis]|nr:hypothetical protein EV363DRAFT_1420651 [Boletus edulis]
MNPPKWCRKLGCLHFTSDYNGSGTATVPARKTVDSDVPKPTPNEGLAHKGITPWNRWIKDALLLSQITYADRVGRFAELYTSHPMYLEDVHGIKPGIPHQPVEPSYQGHPLIIMTKMLDDVIRLPFPEAEPDSFMRVLLVVGLIRAVLDLDEIREPKKPTLPTSFSVTKTVRNLLVPDHFVPLVLALPGEFGKGELLTCYLILIVCTQSREWRFKTRSTGSSQILPRTTTLASLDSGAASENTDTSNQAIRVGTFRTLLLRSTCTHGWIKSRASSIALIWYSSQWTPSLKRKKLHIIPSDLEPSFRIESHHLFFFFLSAVLATPVRQQNYLFTMFRTRSLFSRLFRLRKRRPAKVDPGSTNVAQASSSLSAPPPPKQHRPVSLHPEAIHHAATPSTRRPHSLYPTLHLSPIVPSPLPTSVSTSTFPSSNVPLPRVILIEHLEDEPRVTFPPPPAHAPPSDVGARLAPSHLAPSPLPSASKSPHARCVSFQLPPTTTVVDADAESVAESDVDSDTDATAWQYRLATPSSSTCSTLVGAHPPHSEAVGKGKGETTEPAIVPTDPPPAYTYNTLVSTPSAPVSPSTSTSRSTTAKARHVSLFHPQPAQARGMAGERASAPRR